MLCGYETNSNGSGSDNAPKAVHLWMNEGCHAFKEKDFHVTFGKGRPFDIYNLFIGKEKLPTVEKNRTEFGIVNPDYTYSDAQRIMPFWKSNIMYNECITFEENNGEIIGKLLFVPNRIITIVDYSLKKEYTAGVDFEWMQGTNKVKWLKGSAIPYYYEGALQGCKEAGSNEKVSGDVWDDLGRQLLDGCTYSVSAFLYEKQVAVTYEYDIAQIQKQNIPYMSYQGAKLPRMVHKLLNNEDIKVLFLGASTASGCDASGMYGRAPQMPAMHNLFKEFLQTQTTGNVTVTNFGFGGSTVQEEIDSLTNTVNFMDTNYNFSGKYDNYDLLIVEGIVNDLNMPTSYITSKMKELIDQVKTASPSIEVIVWNEWNITLARKACMTAKRPSFPL